MNYYYYLLLLFTYLGIYNECIYVHDIFESFFKNIILANVLATENNSMSDKLSYLTYLLIDISSKNMHLLSRTQLMGVLSLTASRYILFIFSS